MSDYYGSSTPPQPYPSAPPPPYPSQPASPYPVVGYPTPYAAAKRPSSALGAISLALIGLGAAASGVLMAMMTAAIDSLARTSHYQQSYEYQSQVAAGITGELTGLILIAAVGFVCWILAIVATAIDRGRIFGIIGIVVGVLTPIVVWGYFAIALASTVQQYAR